MPLLIDNIPAMVVCASQRSLAARDQLLGQSLVRRARRSQPDAYKNEVPTLGVRFKCGIVVGDGVLAIRLASPFWPAAEASAQSRRGKVAVDPCPPDDCCRRR